MALVKDPPSWWQGRTRASGGDSQTRALPRKNCPHPWVIRSSSQLHKVTVALFIELMLSPLSATSRDHTSMHASLPHHGRKGSLQCLCPWLMRLGQWVWPCLPHSAHWHDTRGQDSAWGQTKVRRKSLRIPGDSPMSREVVEGMQICIRWAGSKFQVYGLSVRCIKEITSPLQSLVSSHMKWGCQIWTHGCPLTPLSVHYWSLTNHSKTW